jgi:LAS superfamily LD-carboxypeptidase LdcB
MKKFISLATAGLILTAIVGCSSSNTAATNANSTSSPQASQGTQQSNQQRPRMGSIVNNQELLTLLKIDSDTLKQEFKAGKSLADIAAEKKVPEQQVIDLMVKDSTQRIDKSVQSGKLTKDKADQMKANLKDQVTKMVERKGGVGFGGKRAGRGQHQNGAQQDDVSTAQN